MQAIQSWNVSTVLAVALMLVAACLASYGGFACLALAMPEHWERWRGRSPRAVPWRWLRPAGLGLLALAYGLCVWRDGDGLERRY